jgi:tetratricopeptide (TPR) repeat protein
MNNPELVRQVKYQSAENNPELMRQGKYQSAIDAATAEIGKHPDDDLCYRERAHLYLFTGDTQRARSDFDATIKLEPRPSALGRIYSDNEVNAIGVTYWIEGHRELALAFWRYTTSALLSNRVSYSFRGGGIEAGLMLWFGAVYTKRVEDTELTRSLFLNCKANIGLTI